MSIPKFARSSAVAAGAVAVALAAGAFTASPAHTVMVPQGIPHSTSGIAAHHTTVSRSAHTRSSQAWSGRAEVVQPGGLISSSTGKGSAKFATNSNLLISRNWGGYAAERHGTTFRSVSATFFVPYLDCADANTYSGHWVGLDGLTNQTAEQDGIQASCNGSSPLYAAWWEMFPKPPVYPNVTIKAGDSITASVTYRSGKFTLSLANTTTGHHFSVTERCPAGSSCARSSAEIISEAPSSGTGILPLANYRAESFSNIKIASSARHSADLRARWWTTDEILMEGTGGRLSQPTAISGGTMFDMYWMRED